MENGEQASPNSQQDASASGKQPGQGAASGNPGQAGQQSGTGSSASQSGAGNQPGTGQMPGGGGARSPQGGGGLRDQAGDPGSDQLPKDESKPSPPAQEPNNPFGNDDVAPAGAEQSNLTLGRLPDALKDAATVKELEERTGMTKEQLEQFAKKYEKPKIGPGREAKDVEVKVGEQAPVAPSANLPGAGVQRFNTEKIRARGGIPQDTARGLNEGNVDQPPQELRERYFSYKSKAGRAAKATPKRRP
jgi:hypothetical protein